MRTGRRSSEQATGDGRAAKSGLTLRQAEILALLRSGKANKDIAYELGIGLGTVKQHVVALFRKLDVSNRTSAVSRGYEMDWTADPLTAAVLSASGEDSLVELRPASVLSMAVLASGDDEADDRGWRILQRAAALATSDYDCTVVTRLGEGVDIIFGLHRADDADCLHAVATAQAVFDAVGEECKRTAAVIPALRGGLATGFLLASMRPRGGWTGETVAGRTIARARDLRDEASAGTLAADAISRRMMAFARRAAEETVDEETLPLDRLVGSARRRAASTPVRLLGRQQELAVLVGSLDALAAGSGGVALIEGEAGMGKTTLSRACGAEAIRRGLVWIECRCGETAPIEVLSVFGRGQGRPPRHPGVEDALAGVRRGLDKGRVAVLIDDAHLADADEQTLITRLAEMAAVEPLLVVVACRSQRHARLEGLNWQPRLRLGHLEDEAIGALAGRVASGSLVASEISAIVELAHGVPLFAVELARWWPRGRTEQRPRPPMSLIALVASRLDTVRVHRSLLRAVAKDGSAAGWDAPALEVEQEVATAIEARILVRGEGDRLSFAHPLVREVLRCLLLIERGGTDMVEAQAWVG